MTTPKYPEAAFLATMTASVTHEVRNVLAIIKESAGLLDDMALLFEKRGTLDREKLSRTVTRIDEQVKRGAGILSNLNHLSHTLDQDRCTVQLDTEVDRLVLLIQRLAGKRGQSVGLGSCSTETVTVCALHLHMALFSALELFMEALPADSVISLSVRREAHGPMVELAISTDGGKPDNLDIDEGRWTTLTTLTESLPATLEGPGQGFLARVHFPTTNQG
jgi:signal transduction histidine kinase